MRYLREEATSNRAPQEDCEFDSPCLKRVSSMARASSSILAGGGHSEMAPAGFSLGQIRNSGSSRHRPNRNALSFSLHRYDLHREKLCCQCQTVERDDA